jgi:hypothetical protein
MGAAQARDSVELTVQRPGIPDPLLLRGTFRANSASTAEGWVARDVGDNITRLLPVPFLIVGLAVLFLRLEDPNAWLLALLFGGFLAIPGLPAWFLNLPFSLRVPALAYRVFLNNSGRPFLLLFRNLSHALSPRPVRSLVEVVRSGDRSLSGCARPGVRSGRTWDQLRVAGTGFGRLAILVFNYGFITLGFVALIWNSWSANSSEARRKIGVIL